MSPIRRAKNLGHLVLAIGANVFNLFPSRGLTVIGVTGTDGKTTTSNLIYHLLKESGKKAAVISTIGAVIDGKNYETGFHVTTPSPFAVQKYIRLAKERGCSHIVLEVTSHALDQNRVWGVPFQIGVLTNITHEHLDYHVNYDTYVATKLKLFQRSDISIVNSNGEWFGKIKKNIPKEKLITYSLHGAHDGDITVLNLPFKIKTNLIGDFNLENILASVVTAQVLGLDMKKIEEAIQTFEAPVGRQEEIVGGKGRIMVDFAHTANSFENILPELRKRITGRLIHVFGAAGLRDKEKRPAMGRAASFYDDVIILTAEDPRTEKVSEINRQISQGIDNKHKRLDRTTMEKGKVLYEIEDREEAIKFALTLLSKNDLVVVTGKGHERSMNYGGEEINWSDQDIIRKYLKNNS